MDNYYTASKVRDAGRQRFAVIFRHPVRLDAAGKPGRRVRRGLGTSDEHEAEALVEQLNILLGSEEYWTATARGTAEGRFDERIVAVFFDGMDPESLTPSRAMRDSALPLPTPADDYRQVLLLGTTGAGKTTVVRQMLGTDPKRHRFPSTSTAKTTIAETEIVLADGPFQAVVTFFRRDEVVDHLADCASKAALAALRGASDEDARRTLLDHENQRFRFSYVLGRGIEESSPSNEEGAGAQPESVDEFDDLNDDLDEEDEADSFEAEPEGLASIDPAATAKIISDSIETLRLVVADHEESARAELEVADEEDERVARELLDEELDKLVREDERFNDVVDGLLDEIEKRFDAISVGSVTRDRQGWPAKWEWSTDDQAAFLRAVNRFTSNFAPMFGHLLTPLVDGIRVSGPFRPAWSPEMQPKLVLIDGEGLGHTPKSSATLPTSVVKRIDEVDVVMLVDNAAQPMQASPAKAVRSMLTSGNINKLVFCFTHFEEVTGDNLTNRADRARHVIDSAENLLATVREEFSPRSERALRKQLDANRVFLSAIHEVLSDTTSTGRFSIKQFKKLLDMIQKVGIRPELGASRPRYDKANLVLAITSAVAAFHERWNALLGITFEPNVDKEHWTRVKALNRRFAEGTADQYDTLRPVSDIREFLKDEIYRTLETPLNWTKGMPQYEETINAVTDEFANEIARALEEPIRERLSLRPQKTWQDAYRVSGPGSTFVRARRIADDILSRNVPIPGAAPSPDKNEFLYAVMGSIERAASTVEVDLH